MRIFHQISFCDDDVLYRGEVYDLIKDFCARHTNLNITVSAFSRGDILLEAARTVGGFDIYLLDIIMPQINGIALGVKLRQAGFNALIIYLTSIEEYAEVEFDKNGIPVSHEAGHGFGTRSIVAFCEKHDAFLEFKASDEKFLPRISF